jgi:hypothetical protein
MSKITEQEIGQAVLRILADGPGGSATIEQLKKTLPHYVQLSEEDRKPSETRNGEEVWEQQLRNLVSHRTTEGNIICEGYAAYEPGSLTITEAGRNYLR